MKQGIGEPVRRIEDARLLRGRGCFSDDVSLSGQVYAWLCRTSESHARVVAIDANRALVTPGVIAILTGVDYLRDGNRPLRYAANPADAIDSDRPALSNRSHDAPFEAPQMPLAIDTVRHVGEGIALVIARSLAAARDAAERIDVTYERLPATVIAADARLPGATALWAEAGSNVCVDAEQGDRALTEALFATAAHTVHGISSNQRVVAAQLEPRAAVARFDTATGRYTLYAGSQGSHALKRGLAQALAVEPQRVRVVARDVGGGFGPRGFIYPEFVLIAWAARRLGRPVKWTSERSDSFLSDIQGRDLVTESALALDADGTFLAFKARLLGNLGAHTVSFVPLANGPRVATSLYAMQAAYLEVVGVTTNTLPTGPYRGAGRPEAMLALERLIDKAARALGVDRIELRQRNLIPPSALPYRTPTGLSYDTGAFAQNMAHTMAMADWAGFEKRRAQAQAHGRLRGIGLANYVEAPVGAPIEYARIQVHASHRVEVIVGTQSHGQGHETSFAQVVAATLGVPMETVRVIFGDTDLVPRGGGTHSDRSMRIAGQLMVDASRDAIAAGRATAARILEAAVEDIDFAAGHYRVTGTDRTREIFAVAGQLAARGETLSAERDHRGRIPAHPNGCAVCEVEIDPETGKVEIVNYATTDDVGQVINPMIVHGQVHGGIAMGIGQALLEACVYAPDSGQLLTASFLDYAIPRAGDLPRFLVELNEVPTSSNYLGVKGAGEGGTTPALAAVMNAIDDALDHLGVAPVDMPANPERVWRAIRDARGGPAITPSPPPSVA